MSRILRIGRGPLPADNVTGLALRNALASLILSPNATDAELEAFDVFLASAAKPQQA